MSESKTKKAFVPKVFVPGWMTHPIPKEVEDFHLPMVAKHKYWPGMTAPIYERKASPESSMISIDEIPEFGKFFFDQMIERKCYKVTITFNRKYWKKSRAFKHVYPMLQNLLEESDVYESMFYQELHKDGWPHIHGLVNWENDFYTSSDFLRQLLSNRFGQTKIFEYKPDEFKEVATSQGKSIEYESWHDYMSKCHGEMKTFRYGVMESFPIAIVHTKLHKNADTSFEEFFFSGEE